MWSPTYQIGKETTLLSLRFLLFILFVLALPLLVLVVTELALIAIQAPSITSLLGRNEVKPSLFRG